VNRRVAIVGGGVAGLTAAYFLRRGGAEVILLESAEVGNAASVGNAGWLCPAQAGPLPEPGVVSDGIRSLLDRDSALYFAPSYLPRMLPWLVRFAAHCNVRDHRCGAHALGRLGRRTFELTEMLVADGVDFELHRDGLLVAAEREQAARAFLRGLAPLRALGYRIPDALLDGPAVRALEPALSERVSAGLLIEQHWHVHPTTLMRGLARRLREMGVVVREGSEVIALDGPNGAPVRVRTSAGTHEADAVVLAAGAWTPGVARGLGLRIPVQAGKGYSFEIAPEQPLRHAVLLIEPHVGVSPLNGRVRLAGTMEFSGVNARLDRRRIESIVRGAAPLLPSVARGEIENPWTGMRPIAPDGLPIIGRSPRHPNVYLATGYSMLGMTLAAPAGEALARMILSGERPAELDPFTVERFAGHRLRARRTPAPA
jgi:D-amino-acid dehydrogenase